MEKMQIKLSLASFAIIFIQLSCPFSITTSENVTCNCLSYFYGADYDCLEKHIMENGPLSETCLSLLKDVTCAKLHSDRDLSCQNVKLQQYRSSFELVSDGVVDCSRDTLQMFQLKADHELTFGNYQQHPKIPAIPMELHLVPDELCLERFDSRPKFNILAYQPHLLKILMMNYNHSNLSFRILLKGSLETDNPFHCPSENEGAARLDHYSQTKTDIAHLWLNIDYQDGLLNISENSVPRCSYYAYRNYPDWFEEFAFSFPSPNISSWNDTSWNLGTCVFTGSRRSVLNVATGIIDFNLPAPKIDKPSGLMEYSSKSFDIRPQQNTSQSKDKLDGFSLQQSRTFNSTNLFEFSWRCNHKIFPESASKISPRHYEIQCKVLTDSDAAQPEECKNCFSAKDKLNCSLCWDLAVFQKVLGPQFTKTVPVSMTHHAVIIQRKFPNITDADGAIRIAKIAVIESMVPLFQYDYYSGKYSSKPDAPNFGTLNLDYEQHFNILENSIILPGPFRQPTILKSGTDLVLMCKAAAKYETHAVWSDLMMFPSSVEIHPVKLLISFVGTFNRTVQHRSTHFAQMDQETGLLSTDFDDQILSAGQNRFHGFFRPAVAMSQSGPVSIKEPLVQDMSGDDYSSVPKNYSPRNSARRVACFHWTFERWYAFVETGTHNEYVLSFNEGSTGDLRWNEIPWKAVFNVPLKGIPVVIKCPQLHSFLVWSVVYSEKRNSDLKKFGRNNIAFMQSRKDYPDWKTHVYMLNLDSTTGLPSGDVIQLHSSDLCGNCSKSNSSSTSPYFDVVYSDLEDPSSIEIAVLCGDTVCRHDFHGNQKKVVELVSNGSITWLSMDLQHVYYIDEQNPATTKKPESDQQVQNSTSRLTSTLKIVPFKNIHAKRQVSIDKVYRNGRRLWSFDDFDSQHIESVATYRDATSLPVPHKDCMFPSIKCPEAVKMIQEGTLLAIASSRWSTSPKCSGFARPKVQYKLKYGVILENITSAANASRFNCSFLSCLKVYSEATFNASHRFVIGNLIPNKHYYLELSVLPALSHNLHALWFPNIKNTKVRRLASSKYVPPPKQEWATGLAVGLPILLAILLATGVTVWLFHRHKAMYRTLQRISSSEIRKLDKIGEGNFGEVWTAEFQKRQTVVVKTLKESASEKEEREFRDEAFLLSKFQHENIVKCLGICLQSRPIMVALEFIQGGSLASYLQAEDVQMVLPVKLLILVVYEVAKGCEYLEKQGYIHRDLAARNILVSTGLKQVKITDFGMAKDIGVGSHYKVRLEDTIPVAWTPPEGFSGHFSSKSDIWSFGILVWEVFTWASTPYGPCCFSSTDEHICPMTILSQNEIEFEVCVQKKNILDISHPCTGDLCEPLTNILRLCFQYKPEDRPSFSQLLHFLCGASKSIESTMVFQKPRPEARKVAHLPSLDIPKPMTPAYAGTSMESNVAGSSMSFCRENPWHYARQMGSQDTSGLAPAYVATHYVSTGQAASKDKNKVKELTVMELLSITP